MDILILPKACDKLIRVSLPRPSDGELQHYLHDEQNIALYEITKYSDDYRSWFLDNQFCKSGHFNILTKIDPLFIFIPQLIRIASAQFRTLHDICQTYASSCPNESSKLDYALTPDIDWSAVCDTKELDGELFVKFNQNKTLDWLLAKHKSTMEALKQSLGQQTSLATLLSHANDLIGIYIPSSLIDKFKTLTKATAIESNFAKVETDTTKKGSKRPNESVATPTSEPQRGTKKPKEKSSTPAAKNIQGSILQYYKKADSG